MTTLNALVQKRSGCKTKDQSSPLVTSDPVPSRATRHRNLELIIKTQNPK